MISPAALFRTILTGLMAVIATIAAKDRTRTEFLVRVHHHLNRTIQRFGRLVAHWRNNTLPKQGKPRPGRPTRPQTTLRLPTGKAWLQRALNDNAANGHAAHLQHFLTTTEFTQFLAEVPRATRILRPLARARGLQMPGDPPPPAPKPSFTPDQLPTAWSLLPADQRIGVRVITADDPNHPNFSKPR